MKTTSSPLATVPSALDHHFRQALTFVTKAMGHLSSIDPAAVEALGSVESTAFLAALKTLSEAHDGIRTAQMVAPIVKRRPRKKLAAV